MFKDYFFVFKVTSFVEKTLVDEEIMKFTKKFMKLRLKKVKYLETLTLDDEVYMVIGTARVENHIRTKVFFLELYAYLKDEKLVPSFEMIQKQISNIDLKIFKISKIKWLK
jgi:hypothetical protein